MVDNGVGYLGRALLAGGCGPVLVQYLSGRHHHCAFTHTRVLQTSWSVT